MTSLLAGQVAVVTGGASGIGRAAVLGLAELGATILVLDRDEAGMAAAADEASKTGGQAWPMRIDLADIPAIPALVARILDRFKRIDILVNCAGITGRSNSLVDLDEQEWDLVQTVNLKAPMVLMKHVSRHMIERGDGGRIVNVSSSSAFRSRSARIAYASSKAALVQLTRSAAAELGRHGINVNAVAPGITATPMTQSVHGESRDLQIAASAGYLENLLHRVSMPEDVAAAIVFLCEPRSRQITGQTIHTSAGAIV